ncbi:uncharacterized protein LOC112679715 [Sipha flava]|uniref:Uncharacterized protein LOC112679715 n=1 Tax=Sipha flava TaxID=143950 RepID=A0A8B8F427_9HEMI|nr:uncharacterized protein LOC112679715 [Sipha flava]
MSSLLNSIIFRLKLTQVILSLGSIVPVFSEIYVTLSLLTADFVHLTLYGYLGIGIVVLASLCISEPVSEKVTLYSSSMAVFLHLLSAVFIIKDVFGQDSYMWGLRVISGLCTGANAVAFGWEVLYIMKYIHH